MWENANGKIFDASSFKFDLTEMSLTSNMPLKEMLDRKIKWKTVDDKFDQPAFLERTFNPESVTLEPQRIRVFKVVCSPVSNDETMFLQ